MTRKRRYLWRKLGSDILLWNSYVGRKTSLCAMWSDGLFFGWEINNHQLTPSAVGWVEGSIRYWLKPTYVSSFTPRVPGPRQPFRTMPLQSKNKPWDRGNPFGQCRCNPKNKPFFCKARDYFWTSTSLEEPADSVAFGRSQCIAPHLQSYCCHYCKKCWYALRCCGATSKRSISSTAL